ncbi:MAG: PP2C family protein-serine/threonine phosphatase, partial [Acidobacteria bacterium]|nr:PP2C family protein-serine/threonine phosphatase [Acidobacteriota bacterium]
TEQPILIGASGPPLGMLPGRTYETESWTFNPGAQLLLYTDGLTEVFQGDEEFGEERLLGLIEPTPQEAFLDHAWRSLAQFAGNAKQTDDMTALYLYRAQQGGHS